MRPIDAKSQLKRKTTTQNSASAAHAHTHTSNQTPQLMSYNRDQLLNTFR